MLSRRVILRTLLALPILLCLAGWLWSSTHETGIGYGYGDRYVFLLTQAGTLRLICVVGFANPGWCWENDTRRHSDQVWLSNEEGDDTWFLGFSYSYVAFTLPRPVHSHRFCVPYWFLIVVFGGVFAWVWRKTRKPDPKTAFPVEVAAASGRPAAAGTGDEKNPKRKSGC